jgi:hypothetical protein
MANHRGPERRSAPVPPSERARGPGLEESRTDSMECRDGLGSDHLFGVRETSYQRRDDLFVPGFVTLPFHHGRLRWHCPRSRLGLERGHRSCCGPLNLLDRIAGKRRHGPKRSGASFGGKKANRADAPPVRGVELFHQSIDAQGSGQGAEPLDFRAEWRRVERGDGFQEAVHIPRGQGVRGGNEVRKRVERGLLGERPRPLGDQGEEQRCGRSAVGRCNANGRSSHPVVGILENPGRNRQGNDPRKPREGLGGQPPRLWVRMAGHDVYGRFDVPRLELTGGHARQRVSPALGSPFPAPDGGELLGDPRVGMGQVEDVRRAFILRFVEGTADRLQDLLVRPGVARYQIIRAEPRRSLSCQS